MIRKRLPSWLRVSRVIAGLKRLGATAVAPIEGLKAPGRARCVESPVLVRVTHTAGIQPPAHVAGTRR